jgi:hypothetical protein
VSTVDPLKRAEYFVRANLKSTAELATATPKIKALVLGGPKCGKTSLAPTCPKPVILDGDDGAIVLRKHDLPIITSTSWFGMMETILWLLKAEHDYETFFVDGINHFQADYISHLQEKKLKKTGGSSGSMDPALWGALKKECMEFNRGIHKLVTDRGMHVVVTCHSKLQTDDQGRPIGNGPDLQGDFAKSITKAVDIMCYATVVEGKDEKAGTFEHLILTRPYTIHTGAGDRWADEGTGVDATTGRPGVALPDVGKWIEVLREAAPEPVGKDISPAETTGDPKSTSDAPPSSPAIGRSEPGPSEPEAPTPGSVESEGTAVSTEGEPTDPEAAPSDGVNAEGLHDQIRAIVEDASENGAKGVALEMKKFLRSELDKWAESEGIAGKLKVTDVEDIPFLMGCLDGIKATAEGLPF